MCIRDRALGVHQALRTGVERVRARPDFDDDLRPGRTDGHDDLAFDNDLGVGIPLGMGVFLHDALLPDALGRGQRIDADELAAQTGLERHLPIDQGVDGVVACLLYTSARPRPARRPSAAWSGKTFVW